MLNDPISIVPENYPNRLLLGSEIYKFNFEIINNNTSDETFSIILNSDSLEVSSPKEFNKPFKMKSLETKKISIEIRPIIDGKAKLVIQVNQNKKISYIEKEWQPRARIEEIHIKNALSLDSSCQIEQIFEKYTLPTIQEMSGSKSKSIVEQQVNEWIKAKTPDIPEEKRDYINIKLLELAGSIFNSDPEYAFEILCMIEQSIQKNAVVSNFILGYARVNHKEAIKKINLIEEQTQQQNLLKKIIYGIALDHIQDAINLVDKISETEIKNQILYDLLHLYFNKDPDRTLILVKQLNDESQKAKIYFELVKFLYGTDRAKCNSILENLLQNYNILTKNDILIKILILFAAINNPKKAISYFNELSDELKEKYKDTLLNILWNEIEVQKTKYKPTPIFSTYFTFNSVSKSNPILEKLVECDGNISENLIKNEMTSFIGIVSLFKFNFPIFPIIERCYEEIWNEKNNSFYYLIMPTEANLDEEMELVEDMVTYVFKRNAQKVNSPIFIFNLDFIPYLSKPTIIISDSDENLLIKSIVDRVFNDSISLIIDDGLFKGGKIYENLAKVLPNNKFKVINLVMTYDFLNDYSMFKNFLGEFIK